MVAAAKAFAAHSGQQGRPLPGSGNGSLMRTGPVCLPFLGDRPKVAEAARKVSALTHADKYDEDACAIWSLLVESAITREGEKFHLAAAVESALAYVPEDRRYVWAALCELALAPTVRAPMFRSNGSAFAAFAASLSAVGHASSYEQAVQAAACGGDDSDTVAAITGSLAGAVYGCLAIPAKLWRNVWALSVDGPVDTVRMARIALDAAGPGGRRAA